MNELATQPKPSMLTTRVPSEQIARLDALAEECSVLARTEMSQFRRTFLLATGMKVLRDLITDEMMADVMTLQGSPLGFRTDKDAEGGYPLKVVKEAAIEATLRGLRLVGNEINIIAGRCYAAKDGLRRLVRQWPGLSDLRIEIHTPRVKDGYTVVPCRASWKLHGVPQSLDCTGDLAIPVRVNKDQIVDAIMGKAQRKLLARIYDQLCGSEQGLVEADEEPPIDAAALCGPPTMDQGRTAAEPAEAAVSEDQRGIVEEYLARVEACQRAKDLSPVVREAGEDARLNRSARARVAQAANRRAGELRGGLAGGSQAGS